MKIQILGMGCSKCIYPQKAAERAVLEAGVAATVEKVTDLSAILDFSPMALPALAVDGQVKSAGLVLSAEQIKSFSPNDELTLNY